MNYLAIIGLVIIFSLVCYYCFDNLNKHNKKVIKTLKTRVVDTITKETVLKNQTELGKIDDPIIDNQYDYAQVKRPIIPESKYTEKKTLGEAPIPMPDDTINNNLTYVSSEYFPPVRDIDYAASVILPNA